MPSPDYRGRACMRSIISAVTMLDQPHPAAAALTQRVTDRIPRLRPLLVVGVLAWLVPGLGHLVMGRPKKAIVMLAAIGGLFATGLALTAFTCVNPDEYGLEFAAQIFAGGPTLAALLSTKGLTVTEFMPHFDAGRLYVDVAGLLNVVAISDALGLALRHNGRVAAVRQLGLERERQELLALQQVAEDNQPSTLVVDDAPEESPPSPGDVFPGFGWVPDEEGDPQ